MNPRDRIRDLLLQRAIKISETPIYKLASGEMSKFYINSKDILFHAEAIRLIGELLYEATQDANPAAIGGLEVGAIPMATAASLAYHLHGRHIEGFFVRKTAKGYGEKKRLEGHVQPGDRVAVIDDVLTSGGSLLQTIEEVEALGAVVVRVTCLVDRLAGAGEKLAKYDYRPLFTIRDFGMEPTKN